MRMIDRIKQAMRDTGACDWLTSEELEIAATAAVEAMREPNKLMVEALYTALDERSVKPTAQGQEEAIKHSIKAMIEAALNE